MKILYLDIDCLRPDHLGCYGYRRATSPNIDAVAQKGLRFNNVFASDVPCLPSRTAFFSGRFGIKTGVANHGGRFADPFPEGKERGFASAWNRTSFMRILRDEGYHTATVSSFGERHSALHFYSNFNDIRNPGKRGLESGHEVTALALQWIAQRGHTENWFLHVHFWDPHMPYRAPQALGTPFANAPIPAWYSEQTLAKHRAGCGPHSAREVIGYSDQVPPGIPWDYPRQPLAMNNMQDVRAMFDGYDTGVLYADQQVGRILRALQDAGIADDLAIVISGDHGESLGELNVYGDHQTADPTTAHVPFILHWPGVTEARGGEAENGLHYQIDMAATLATLAGGRIPQNWDGKAVDLGTGQALQSERPYLVVSQGAWTCQRGVRFNDQGKPWHFIRTYHDAFHLYDPCMLFELNADPHLQNNVAALHPHLIEKAERFLDQWQGEALAESAHGDPLRGILEEGGPKHTRGELPGYLARLRDTERQDLAERIVAIHGTGEND